jgi:S-adenosyl-L-methionine hydrolase (adenosine-forming)
VRPSPVDGFAPTRITLLTDFGTGDGYVAAMRGVIAGIAPGALVDDATHDIPPGNVRYGAYAFGRYWRLYPPGTIHVLVVDPGVGTDRRGLAGVLDGRLVVAPDNGLLSVALAQAESVRLVRITATEFFREPVSGIGIGGSR